jgi:PQQ enzyme repeat
VPDGAEISEMQGTPYGLYRAPGLVSPLELPCNKPPWGTLLALDTDTGDVKWEVPLGTVRDLAPVPLPIKWGTPNLGGPIVTQNGLVFIGAAMDNYLRAFDLQTGKELWKGRLPAGGQATPMTYRLGEKGRQFVVIAAGGHGRMGTDIGDSVVAFALPESDAGLVAQSMAPTLRTVGVLLVLLMAAWIFSQSINKLADHVRGGSYRLAIDPSTQSPLSASANIGIAWSRVSITGATIRALHSVPTRR